MGLRPYQRVTRSVLAVILVLACCITPSLILDAAALYVAIFCVDVMLHLILQTRARLFWILHYLSRIMLLGGVTAALRAFRNTASSRSTAGGPYDGPDAWQRVLNARGDFSLVELLVAVTVAVFYDSLRVAVQETLAFVYDVYVEDESMDKTNVGSVRVRHVYPLNPHGSIKAFREMLRCDLEYDAASWKQRGLYTATGRKITSLDEMAYGQTYYIRRVDSTS